MPGTVSFTSYPGTCIAGAGIVIIFDLLTISLNRGFSPLEHTISEFVLLDYGWIERTGLFLLGAAMLALGIVWFRRLGDKTNRLFHLSGLILVLLGLCFLIVATFYADASETGLTVHGAIHKVAAAIIVFVFPFFCLIVAWSLRDKPPAARPVFGFYRSDRTVKCGLGRLCFGQRPAARPLRTHSNLDKPYLAGHCRFSDHPPGCWIYRRGSMSSNKK